MQHLIDAVRHAIQEKNWYAALATALTMPDIAGKLDGRTGGSQARFVTWFNDYMRPKYTDLIGSGVSQKSHVFLSGNDCYALRCAYLHQGEFDITTQKAKDVLDHFKFVAPFPGRLIHRNQTNNVLQLQVDVFCEEMCAAVDEWLRARGADPSVAATLVALPQIESMSAEFRM
jgi:hypothetical protein